MTLLASLAVGSVAAAPVPASVPFAVQVVATPSNGSLPLTVTFTATVTQGTPSSVDWTFGDGTAWNGTGPAALSVVHRYVTVGSFVAVATVVEAAGSSSAFARVNVESGPLTAQISVTSSGGPAPVMVTFRAVVTGGTGTYTSFAWSFGDGGIGAGPVVNYTYRSPGTFVPTLTVRDSANETARATASVPVGAGPTSSASGPLAAWAVPTLATAGVLGAGLAVGGLYLGRRRRSAAPALETVPDDYDAGGPMAARGGPAPGAGSALPPPLAAAAVGSSAMPATTAEESPARSLEVPKVALAPAVALPAVAAVAAPTPRATADEPRRWSREIVGYLGSLPILGPDDIPSLDWTQKGMSERLGTGQNQVSNVLRRLVAAGIVIEELQHVQGQPRRLKVYRLTPRGEALAREVRRRKAAARNPGALRP